MGGHGNPGKGTKVDVRAFFGKERKNKVRLSVPETVWARLNSGQKNTMRIGSWGSSTENRIFASFARIQHNNRPIKGKDGASCRSLEKRREEMEMHILGNGIVKDKKGDRNDAKGKSDGIKLWKRGSKKLKNSKDRFFKNGLKLARWS